MKKTFICSLCRGGILGGALYLDDTAVTYKTNKLTVAEEYRNIRIPLAEISELSWHWLLFPVATFKMSNGKEFKFIIFNKKRFEDFYTQVKHVV